MRKIERYSALRTQAKVVQFSGENGISHQASTDIEYAGGEFGRDSESVAEGNLLLKPDIARRTIIARALDQGVGWNYPDAEHPSTEEQPGRILHEKRFLTDEHLTFLRSHFSSSEEFEEFRRKCRDKSDRLIQQWGDIYYGSVDATPKYITLVKDYIATTGDNKILDQSYTDKLGRQRTIYDSVLAAADWIYNNATYGPNVNPLDGLPHEVATHPLLKFKRLNGKGIENQVMMDSSESFIFPDGKRANHDYPIADIGTQGKSYDALLYAAQLLRGKGTAQDQQKAQRFVTLAGQIQANTLSLWQEDLQYFAMGEDQSGPIPTHSANVGELLNSSIFDNLPEKLRAKYISGIANQLFHEGFYTAVGFRLRHLNHHHALDVNGEGTTIPFDDYHGPTAVWIETNHEIAQGLDRQGLHDLANQVKYATIDGVNIEGKPTEFFRVAPDGRVLYNQKQHLTEEDADFHVTSLAEEEQAWSNSAVIDFKTQLARRDRPTAKPHRWQIALQRGILLSLQTRGLYKSHPMKTMKEIIEARQHVPNLTINETIGRRLQRSIHKQWEEDTISQPAVA